MGSSVSWGGSGVVNTGGTASPVTSGWANYRDPRYTVDSAFLLQANVRTLLPNNAGIKDESQLPLDVSKFYDPATSLVKGTAGSDFILTVRLKARAKNSYAQMVKIEIDTGTDQLPRVIEASIRTLPWGVDAVTPLTFILSGYVGSNFEANGARVFVTANDLTDIYDISYVIKRTHKGR